MRNSSVIYAAALLLFTCSCEKDKFEKDVIKTLEINSISHSFTADDGNPYLENTLVSQQDKHIYKLKMVKNVEYRISATQPNASMSQVILTLINNAHDTLAVSSVESTHKACISLKSPQTQDYYLIVNLKKRTYLQFNYRIFFEEVADSEIEFSGFQWQCNGSWKTNNSSNAVLTNYESFVYRHLKLTSPISGNPGVSFVIQSISDVNPDFGVIINGSGGILQFSEYISELTKYGYAFLVSKNDMNHVLIKLVSDSMGFDWGSLTSILDYSTGIKFELKYNAGVNRYAIYLNNNYLKEIPANVQLQDFYILVYDNGSGTTTIRDFQLTN